MWLKLEMLHLKFSEIILCFKLYKKLIPEFIYFSTPAIGNKNLISNATI